MDKLTRLVFAVVVACAPALQACEDDVRLAPPAQLSANASVEGVWQSDLVVREIDFGEYVKASNPNTNAMFGNSV